MDLADARSVIQGLAADLDRALLEEEVRSLTASLPEHPISDRWDLLTAT